MHGDNDPLVPVENVDWLEKQLKQAGKSALFAKIVLPGVNHFIPWEHPEEVAKAVKMLAGMAWPVVPAATRVAAPAGLAADLDPRKKCFQARDPPGR